MKKSFLCTLMVLGLIFISTNQARALSYDLNYVFSGIINADPPYATIDIEAISDGVKFTLWNKTAGTENGSSSKLTKFYFNYRGSGTLTWTTPTGWTLSYDENKKKADGDGYFDFELLSITGAIYVAVGSPLEFYIYGDDNPSNFFDLSVSGGGQGTYFFAAHIQALANPEGGSAWVGTPIPEPATMLLLGSGLLGLAGFVRKRFKK